MSEVSKAEFIAESPHYNEQDDIGRELEMVVLCARALIEPPGALGASEREVAERGLPGKLGSCCGPAKRAIHQDSL